MRSTAIGRPSSTVKERNGSKSESEMDQSQRKVRPPKDRTTGRPHKGGRMLRDPKGVQLRRVRRTGDRLPKVKPRGAQCILETNGDRKPAKVTQMVGQPNAGKSLMRWRRQRVYRALTSCTCWARRELKPPSQGRNLKTSLLI